MVASTCSSPRKCNVLHGGTDTQCSHVVSTNKKWLPFFENESVLNIVQDF